MGQQSVFSTKGLQNPKHISLTSNESLDTTQPRKAHVLETLLLKFFSETLERQGLKPNTCNPCISDVQLALFCHSVYLPCTFQNVVNPNKKYDTRTRCITNPLTTPSLLLSSDVTCSSATAFSLPWATRMQTAQCRYRWR